MLHLAEFSQALTHVGVKVDATTRLDSYQQGGRVSLIAFGKAIREITTPTATPPPAAPLAEVAEAAEAEAAEEEAAEAAAPAAEVAPAPKPIARVSRLPSALSIGPFKETKAQVTGDAILEA